MDASKIIAIVCGITLCVIVYLHIKKFIKKTTSPSIKQIEFFKEDEIINNHKQDKNIYIIRVYSDIEENDKILNNIKDTTISAFSLLNLKDKTLEEKVTLHDFVNGGGKFSENMMCYLFNKVKTKNVPALKGIYSPLSVTKNIYVNVGMKLQTLPLICTSQYERCFLHVVRGTIKLRLYDPSQSKYLYRDHQKKMKCLTNTDTCFYNSKINLTSGQQNIDINFPNYNQAFNTEILLRGGNLMYLPNFWWFTIEYQEDSVCLFYTCNTPVSYVYNKVY